MLTLKREKNELTRVAIIGRVREERRKGRKLKSKADPLFLPIQIYSAAKFLSDWTFQI